MTTNPAAPAVGGAHTLAEIDGLAQGTHVRVGSRIVPAPALAPDAAPAPEAGPAPEPDAA